MKHLRQRESKMTVGEWVRVLLIAAAGGIAGAWTVRFVFLCIKTARTIWRNAVLRTPEEER
jgi:hypothetical protein